MPESVEGPVRVEPTPDPTREEGALNTGERWGQGTDATHPDSATGQPIERTTADEETAWKSTAGAGVDHDGAAARTAAFGGDDAPEADDPFIGPDPDPGDETLLV